MAIFSFHPAKTITAGEGGAVLTNNNELARRIRTLRTHGLVRNQNRSLNQANAGDAPWYYEMTTLGYNYRITDFQCALALSQLTRLSQLKARRNQIVSLYNQAFENNAHLILPPRGLADEACPHLYPLQTAKGTKTRLAVYQALKARNIHCQIHYIPIYWQPYYANKYGYEKGKCPRAETYYSRTLSLPLYPAMTDTQIQTVIETVLTTLND
jgi:dTDP-4-amino-4,6-dideoxygalactose transaminase